MTVSGNGGTVTVDGTPVKSDFSYYVYDSLAQVTLEAIPVQGYRFVSWSGSEFNSTANQVTIDMNCNIALTATFSLITPVLTIAKHGDGNILPPVGQYDYPIGTVINLKATPAKGWKFDGWTPNVTNPNSAETSLTLNSDMTVTAGFSRIWSAWLILGIIIVSIIILTIIGGIVWLGFKYRKKLKNTLLRTLRSSYTSLIFRLILGGIFIFAGFAKIHSIGALINEINQYKILPVTLGSIYGHVLPYLEIIIGILLVLGIVLRVSASIAGLLLISFAAAKIAALVLKLNIKVCNCFGVARPLLSNQSLALDLIMLLLAIQIIVFRNELFSIPWKKNRNKK